MSRFHKAYQNAVLKPDFMFMRDNLSEYFLDCMTAHVMTVSKLDLAKDHQAAIASLLRALQELRSYEPDYEPNIPDLYFAYNKKLEAELGEDVVSFLRVGLSRNDLDMTVYKHFLRQQYFELGQLLLELRSSLLQKAEQYQEQLFIANTHHQPGQPITIGFYLTAFAFALQRDSERFSDALNRHNTCPLGAAALAGSSHPLDRNYSAALLGFDAPVANSYEAVSTSDWQFDFASTCQSVALNCSRLATDLLRWAEEDLINLDTDLTQGSSIMPQKKNPVTLEHARTRFSKILGLSQSVLFSSHNIPFGDLNDFGTDVQQTLFNLGAMLTEAFELLNAVIKGLDFDGEKLDAIAEQSDTTATELADELVRSHGVSFQKAHHMLQSLIEYATEQNKSLRDLSSNEVETLTGIHIEAAILKNVLSSKYFIESRNSVGGPASSSLQEQLEQLSTTLYNDKEGLYKLELKLQETLTELRLGKLGTNIGVTGQ